MCRRMMPITSRAVTLSVLSAQLSLLLALTFTFVPFASGQDVSYSVPEEQQANVFVGNVARDMNLRALLPESLFQNLQYSILAGSSSSSHGNLISVNQQTSDLFTSHRLDREALCPFSLVCELSFKVGAVSGTYFKNIQVKVVVLDVNDNAPRFNRSSLTLEIPESVSVGALYSLEGAVDDDTGQNNSVQAYVIQPDGGAFSIVFTQRLDRTSDVALVLSQTLDRETRGLHELKLIATDGGIPRRTAEMAIHVKVLDVNDNSPEFSQPSYSVNIGENVLPGSAILTVTARDSDEGVNGQVSYQLSARQDASLAAMFRVDENSGNISLRQLPTSGLHSIIVEAVDHGTPPKEAQVVVEVRVIDNANSAPTMTVSLLNPSISEAARLHTPVAHLSVDDPDSGRNGHVACFSQSAFFDLRDLGGNELMVSVAKPLDREDSPTYRVTVFCQDNGTPPLNATIAFDVAIDDVNDSPPVFGDSVVAVSFPEGNRVGEVVLTLTATDKDAGVNAELTYKHAGDAETAFQVLEHTGAIVAARPLDREKKDLYLIQILAVDRGSPQLSATATVSVYVEDLNDEAPEFADMNYRFQVKENAPTGTLVARFTATDPDLGAGGRVSFSLSSLQQYTSPSFQLHPNGTLVTAGGLDREATDLYVFDVIASDEGVPRLSSRTLVRVEVLDDNDNKPVFVFPGPSNSTVVLDVPIQKGSQLFRVLATDVDEGSNGLLTYSMSTPNLTSLFAVDPLTGDIRAMSGLTENHVGMYVLVLEATDSGDVPSSSTATLYVIVRRGPVWQPLVSKEQNAAVVIIIVCVTVVLAAIIVVLVIVVWRRDKCRSLQHLRKAGDRSGGAARSSAPRANVYLERHNSNSSLFITPSSCSHVSGHGSPRHDQGMPGKPRPVTDQSYCWRSESLDFGLKDDNEGADVETLNRVTSLRLQQAYVHINSIKSQLISSGDCVSGPFEWREIHVPGRPEDFHSLSSRDTGQGDSGVGTDEDGTGVHSTSEVPGASTPPAKIRLRPKLGIQSFCRPSSNTSQSFCRPGSNTSQDTSKHSSSSLPNVYLKPGSDILVFRPASATSCESNLSDTADDNCTTTSGSYSLTFDDTGSAYCKVRATGYVVHDIYV